MRTTKATFAIAVATLVGACWLTASCGGDDTGTAGAGGSTGTGGGTGGAPGSGGTPGSGGADASTGTGGAPGSGGTGGVDASTGTGGNRDAGPDARDAATEAEAGANPAPPLLGMQIDRLGRPAINAALIDAFDTLPTMTPDQAENAYNAASDPAQWNTLFSAQLAGNIAILDGLDGVCGNQIAAGAADAGSATGRYGLLAGVLADDRLYVNTTKSDAGTVTCSAYLGVEANATGLLPNHDCGGRKPEYDVVDVSYSVLAVGVVGSTPVTDGVANDSTFLTAFPFLAAPNP
jgi:hypothetical protein